MKRRQFIIFFGGASTTWLAGAKGWQGNAGDVSPTLDASRLEKYT